MTKQEFIAFAKENAKKIGLNANLLDSDVLPCNCDYKNCKGWQIATPPSIYLSPDRTIKITS